jgi:hypothetical protein
MQLNPLGFLRRLFSSFLGVIFSQMTQIKMDPEIMLSQVRTIRVVVGVVGVAVVVAAVTIQASHFLWTSISA